MFVLTVAFILYCAFHTKVCVPNKLIFGLKNRRVSVKRGRGPVSLYPKDKKWERERKVYATYYIRACRWFCMESVLILSSGCMSQVVKFDCNCLKKVVEFKFQDRQSLTLVWVYQIWIQTVKCLQLFEIGYLAWLNAHCF